MGVTRSPPAAWATQLAREHTVGLADARRRITHLIRDRDSKFTSAFDDGPNATPFPIPPHQIRRRQLLGGLVNEYQPAT